MTQAHLDRDGRVRDAIYRTRLLVNRTPHFNKATRKEANRALDILDRQLGLNQVNAVEASRGIEMLNRAHSSLTFGLLRSQDFADRFAAALRRLGLRSINDRLDEVPASVMALPIHGPLGAREHRDDLVAEERVDAQGNPLPPLPGFGTLRTAELAGTARPAGQSTAERGRSQQVRGFHAFALWVAIIGLLAIAAITVVEGFQDGFSLWDWLVIGVAALAVLIGVVASIGALIRR